MNWENFAEQSSWLLHSISRKRSHDHSKRTKNVEEVVWTKWNSILVYTVRSTRTNEHSNSHSFELRIQIECHLLCWCVVVLVFLFRFVDARTVWKDGLVIHIRLRPSEFTFGYFSLTVRLDSIVKFVDQPRKKRRFSRVSNGKVHFISILAYRKYVCEYQFNEEIIWIRLDLIQFE